MRALNPATGKLSTSDTTLYHLAQRNAADPTQPDPIENGFVFQRGGYYYLFASYGYCCRAASSTYNIRVGRSTSPTGPFIDADRTPLLQGGGSVVLASHDYVIGPGGQAVYNDDYLGQRVLLVYRYYDTRLPNAPNSLGINYLSFDASGWPNAY